MYEILHKPLLAVVWPRRMTDYAKQVVKRLIEYAKNYDMATVSGMADGVDRLVHEESIKQGIPTVAVLGWWLAHYLKSRDHSFMQKIVDNGWLVLSDFSLKQKPRHYIFPQRNRIVAGLSDVVFVPEASEKSGSLITVDYALSMNKSVYGAPQFFVCRYSYVTTSLYCRKTCKTCLWFRNLFGWILQFSLIITCGSYKSF